MPKTRSFYADVRPGIPAAFRRSSPIGRMVRRAPRTYAVASEVSHIMEQRLLIASNRLPFSVDRAADSLRLRPTCGGLAAALTGIHDGGSHVWIGWPGACGALTDRERVQLRWSLARRRIVPVQLSDAEVSEYYDGTCNAVLWPVLHCLLDRLPLLLPDFHSYREVNERFAEAVVNEYRPGDIIWIHDYHLLLAPALVRRRLPHALIGFFLHTPFPPADVFRALPWRQELLDGLLGASLIGFQTDRDMHNFEETLETLSACTVHHGGVIAGERRVSLGVFPVGIDPLRCEPRGAAESDVPVGDSGGQRVLLGVDRLYYTKGIPRRLLGFERLLERRPELRGVVQLVQVAVPSRSHVEEYARLDQTVRALVERINTTYRTETWTPVRYVPCALPPTSLARLYSAADVMLVTSLRDGMNLVAKEFAAVRSDEDGVLVLSELAGASEELIEAVLVNPYSVDDLATAMATALDMPREERQRRMRALRERVARGASTNWAAAYLGGLTALEAGRPHFAASLRRRRADTLPIAGAATA